ncbi:MAG: nuclear transport factor 2 family protein [Myxococcales bacterium]|nr:nuclear transport factor 2 family protein [Myxococcales bacterium]
MGTDENRRVVDRMWQALYRKDFDGVADCIAADGHYEDVPTPDPGATGPQNVVRRLRMGLDPVERFEHDTHLVVAEGDHVITEHTETWHFETGEKIVNHFVTVHELRDGKIKLWRDYWDLGSMLAQAPKWWIERLAKFSETDFS